MVTLTLTQLPPELVSNVLSFVEPEDLPSLNLTCRYLYHTVRDNTALFRALYLNNLVSRDPLPFVSLEADADADADAVTANNPFHLAPQKDDPAVADLDWIQEIQDLVRLRAICASSDSVKERHLRFVYNTATRLLARSASQGGRPRLSVTYQASRNTHVLRSCFSDPATVEAFLCQSFLFQRARAPIKNFDQPKQFPTEDRLMSAKLHCLFGDMVLNYGRTRSSRTYPFACSKVYDIREYTHKTRWGPFMDDGPGPVGTEGNEEGQLGLPDDRVDWEKVEAIMIVLWSNLKNKELDRLPVFQQFWGVPFAGSWPNSYIPLPMNRDVKDLELQDPYDVSGTWLRVVCFLDYNDFFAYNFPPHDSLPAHLPRPILDEVEATRLIIMKIHVTKIEPPGPQDGQSLPVVHFEGISRSLDSSWDDNANSDLRGTVRLTREGEVRWTTFSIFSGQSRWRSEGIQLGGPRSSKVIGNWFDKDYDPSGPCGPTAFWKIGDRHPSVDDNQITVHDYLPVVDGYEHEPGFGFGRRHLHHHHHHYHDYDHEHSLPAGVFNINSDEEDGEYEDAEEAGSSVVEEEGIDPSGAEDEGDVDRAEEGSTRRDVLPGPEAKITERSGSATNSS